MLIGGLADRRRGGFLPFGSGPTPEDAEEADEVLADLAQVLVAQPAAGSRLEDPTG
jgi:hypothetical protein